MVSKPRTLRRVLKAGGLALLASLALAAAAIAPASALAAVPVNTVLPVATPAQPIQGAVETTSKGTWTESPTSYSYVWYSCNASGVECKSIAGATSQTYTPVLADKGRTLIAEVTAKNSSGSSAALSKPTLPVIVEHWYVCKNVGAGKGWFANPFCSGEKKEGGTYSLSLVTTPTNVVLKGTSPFTINTNIGGVTITVSCTSQSGEGTIENPAGGGAGTLLASKGLTLSGCTVTQPEGTGCKVQSGTIKTPGGIKGAASGFEGKAAAVFSATVGEYVFSYTLESCTNPGLNGIRNILGTFRGILNNEASRFEFTKASTTGLSPNAWLEGTINVETPPVGEKGERIQLAP